MYYDEYRKKEKHRGLFKARRRKRSLTRFFLKLLITVLLFAVFAAGVLYVLPVELFQVEGETDLKPNVDLPASPINVLILGVDALSDNSQRSDTMIVASIGKGTLKLTSLQRDTLADIEGYGTQKLNAAFAHGGADLAVRTINQTFGMNILYYVVVDFTAVVRMVDALGGIEMTISEKEMQHINKNVLLSRRVFAPLGYIAEELTEYGENVHLNGLRALAYARIRKLDSDFVRTSRQRKVIDAMLKRLKENLWNPVVLTRFLKSGLSGIETNMPLPVMFSLGEKALLSGSIEQLRLPADGTFDDNGSSLKMTDVRANCQHFIDFVYE